MLMAWKFMWQWNASYYHRLLFLYCMQSSKSSGAWGAGRRLELARTGLPNISFSAPPSFGIMVTSDASASSILDANDRSILASADSRFPPTTQQPLGHHARR